ncbi:hypothetical protein [uncultured Lactobacillus sp.]|uniref:hypothetical protein n=1 Tax=uncultured Lactobacillus sp. TaxID=153152 RepID=UPI0025D4A93E|nr:hypothetical protein [uncultured Lactobacillus sp.]
MIAVLQDLKQKHYLPRNRCLKAGLTPMAVKNELSAGAGKFYLKIINSKYHDGGLRMISIGAYIKKGIFRIFIKSEKIF